MKRILVVSFILPFPPNSGGSRDIYERVKALRQSGYAVDMIATPRETPDPKDVAAMQSLVDNLWVVQRTRNATALLSPRPFHYETRLGLKTVPLTEEYFATIIESEFVGAILENPALRTKHRILRVHNDEAYLHRSLARDTAGLVERALFLAESYKFSWYSPRVMKQCEQLWYISDAELKKAAGSESAPRSYHVPVVVDQTNFKQPELGSSKVFYAGALSVPINYNGLIWYLKNIHPQLLSIPEYEFTLAGKTGSASIDKLLGVIRSSERVTYCPDLPDLGPLYASSAAFINPIQRGAGVKIKTIDAAISGLPVITTLVGAEGTGFVNDEHAVIADSAEDFASGIRRILKDKVYAHSLVNAAQQLLVEKNGPGIIAGLLAQLP